MKERFFLHVEDAALDEEFELEIIDHKMAGETGIVRKLTPKERDEYAPFRKSYSEYFDQKYEVRIDYI